MNNIFFKNSTKNSSVLTYKSQVFVPRRIFDLFIYSLIKKKTLYIFIHDLFIIYYLLI